MNFTCNATKNRVFPGVMFIFNDAIMITKRHKKKRLLIVSILSYFHVRKTSRWVNDAFIIQWSDPTTITFDNQEKLKHFKEYLDEALEEYRKQRTTLKAKIY